MCPAPKVNKRGMWRVSDIWSIIPSLAVPGLRRRPKVDMQPERALKMTQKENKVHYVSTDHPSCQVGLLEVFQEGDAI